MAFSWAAFDTATRTGLAIRLGMDPSSDEDPGAFLARVAPEPTAEMVRTTKSLLERLWLPQYVEVCSIVRRLIDAGIGPMGSPRTADECVDYLHRCRNTVSVQALIAEAMRRWADGDPDVAADLDVDFVPRFAVLDLRKQLVDDRTPYQHQEEAWQALDGALLKSTVTGQMRGLLVMPTGSGKTYTAIRWLLEKVVAQHIQVLWVAHRHELLIQATREFHKLAAYARGRDELRVRVVSGAHCPASAIRSDDDVVVASVNCLARRPDIQRAMTGEREPFLVVDEAHHTPATSYRDLIKLFGEDNRIRLLGLTATPTRTLEDERPMLSRLFGSGVVYQVGYPELIARGILARPIPVRVQTEARPEEGLTAEEFEHMVQFHDLGPSLLNRIAQLTDRNQVIVQHYLENRERYGRTLVFAINVAHAALLAEQLTDHGVRADYVASYRPDGSEGAPAALIQAFRNGELDVLVNVQIATEGVDVPDVQTVLLTRPTQSEILFRQMVGRALRGPLAGGTEIAYVVSFEDHWERFAEWMDPFELVPDMLTEPPEATTVRSAVAGTPIPWEAIREIARIARAIRHPLKAEAFEAMPFGWYLLERDTGVEDDPSLYAVFVFEHQVACWQAFFEALYVEPAPAISARTLDGMVDDWYDEWFGDCDTPVVTKRDVEIALVHRAFGGERPRLTLLEERDVCDPMTVAKVVLDEDLGERARTELLEERHTQLAQVIYPTPRAFRAAVDDAIWLIQHPDEQPSPRAVPVFEPPPDLPLTEGPAHDLEALFAEVRAAAPAALGIEALPPGRVEVGWSKRLLKGWYAQALWQPSDANGCGTITVNRLLDSPDVPEDVVQFLLWHEYLHLYLQTGHTPEFWELERAWPTTVEGDRFLDTLNQRWWVQYW